MSYVRTPEHRRRQSEAIHGWRPWLRSTGPRSPEGKARAAQNAYKGSVRGLLRQVAKLLRDASRL
jgi:hypothetical protein